MASNNGQMSRALRNQNIEFAEQIELVQMNAPEFLDFAINLQKKRGKSEIEAYEWVRHTLDQDGVNTSWWNENRNSLKTLSSLTPTGLDAAALVALAKDMKRGGSLFSKFKVKNYRGSDYVIFQGYPGLRQHLKGSRYLASNPKIVTYGIGKRGVSHVAKQGMVITILISATFHAVNQILNDKLTWHDFIGGFAIDIGIATAATGLAWGAAALYVGGATAVVATGPLVVIILVGTGASFLLASIFNSDELSLRLSNTLRKLETDLKRDIVEIKHEIDDLNDDFRRDPHHFLSKLFGLSTPRILNPQ